MQQLNAPGLQKREIVMDNDLEVKIKEAPKIADVSRHLTAWVDENIIHPRFAEAVDTWKHPMSIAPDVVQHLLGPGERPLAE
jgi:hypothetical protein